MQRVDCVRKLLKTAFGLVVFGLGSYLTIKADIGLAPWESFSMGLTLHLPFSYGTAHILVSLLFVLIDLLLREKLGYGTILDAVLVGLTVDFAAAADPFPAPGNLAVSVGMMTAGLFVMGLGQFFYMSAGLSCGPRDAFVVAVARRIRRVPVGAVSVIVGVTVLAAGWLLGAPVGIGTVLSSFGMGGAMQAVFALLRFEPRAVQHQDFVQTTRALLQSGPGAREAARRS